MSSDSTVLSNLYNGTVRFYYEQLSGAQKKMYDALHRGIEEIAGEIELPLVSVDEVLKVFGCVLLDNPKIFYVTSFKHLSEPNKQKCVVHPDYKYTAKSIRKNKSIIKRYLQIFDAVKLESEINKEIFVHDYCLNNFRYDYAFDDYSYSILGPILNKAAVCEGIAKFVKLALDYLDVNCIMVLGKAKNPAHDGVSELHSWNIVSVEGRTYHLDVTYDMTLMNKMNRYDYFNLSDKDIGKGHSFGGRIPKCTTSGNDFYSIKSLVAHNLKELDRFINKSLMRGKKNITVKLINVKNPEAIVDKVLSCAQQQYANLYKNSGRVNVAYNLDQMVFEINFS